MIKLDDNLLAEFGLAALPPDDKKKLLAHIYETLEMRVGVELAKQMSEAQLTEFEEFITRNDEAGALRWLETNFPHYKEVVAAEFEKLKAEVKQIAPQILASTQNPTPQPQQPAPQAYSPPQEPGGALPPQQPSAGSQGYAAPQPQYPSGYAPQPQYPQYSPQDFQAPNGGSGT